MAQNEGEGARKGSSPAQLASLLGCPLREVAERLAAATSPPGPAAQSSDKLGPTRTMGGGHGGPRHHKSLVKLDNLPTRDEQGNVRVVVESPRGSRIKLKYDPELQVFAFDRPLVLGVSYPFDWGFIPSTKGPDGDPLDAMVLMDAATYPGVVIAAIPIGVIEVSQKGEEQGRERNDRILMTPAAAPRFDGLRDARELPERARAELERFFLTAVTFEDKGVEILGWRGPDAADELVRRGCE